MGLRAGLEDCTSIPIIDGDKPLRCNHQIHGADATRCIQGIHLSIVRSEPGCRDTTCTCHPRSSEELDTQVDGSHQIFGEHRSYQRRHDRLWLLAISRFLLEALQGAFVLGDPSSADSMLRKLRRPETPIDSIINQPETANLGWTVIEGRPLPQALTRVYHKPESRE